MGWSTSTTCTRARPIAHLPVVHGRLADMRAEIDACLTVEDLERLWRSKPFKQEYEKLPPDWQKLLLEHFKDAKLGIQTAKVQTPPGFVPPNFEGMKA